MDQEIAKGEQGVITCKLNSITDEDIKYCIWFLDCVVSEAIANTKDVRKMIKLYNFTKDFRAVGLGTLGWHTYLQNKMIH